MKLPSGWISCAYRKISNQRNITERVYVSPEKEIFFSKKDEYILPISHSRNSKGGESTLPYVLDVKCVRVRA